jgi:hypothetical protein
MFFCRYYFHDIFAYLFAQFEYILLLCSCCLSNMNMLFTEIFPLLLLMKYGSILVANKLQYYKKHTHNAKNLLHGFIIAERLKMKTVMHTAKKCKKVAHLVKNLLR